MYKIKLRGTKKAVYLAWSNILGYDLPDIREIYDGEEAFTMICSTSTKYDAVPNQQLDSQVWDGTIVDQEPYDIDTAIKGGFFGQFIDKELAVLSGLFGVDISVFGIPDDQWWIDFEMNPEYPYYEYKNGQETVNDTLCREEALNLDFVTANDLGIVE